MTGAADGLTDCPGDVPKGVMPELNALVDAPSLLEQFRLVLHEGKYGNLNGCHAWVKPQKGALLAADLRNGTWRSRERNHVKGETEILHETERCLTRITNILTAMEIIHHAEANAMDGC